MAIFHFMIGGYFFELLLNSMQNNLINYMIITYQYINYAQFKFDMKVIIGIFGYVFYDIVCN